MAKTRRGVIRALTRRWTELIDDALLLAREMGAEDPKIYIECDTFYVMDGASHDERGRSRTDAILFSLGSHPAVDCGAW